MLNVHRAERADVLAAALADVLATPLDDPMQTEIVAVPERGVERWLRQRLSLRLGSGGDGQAARRDGIAANIAFDSPARLIGHVIDGVAADPDAAESWFADRLRWPVLQVIDQNIGAPELTVLAEHLGSTAEDPIGLHRGRRLSTASTVAGLFSSYGWQRPQMIAAWAAGDDTDGTGAALAEHLTWQPWLWRLVREEVGHPHLAEDLAALTQRLVDDPGAVDLPARLALFGPSRIPQTLRTVLAALGRRRRVDLYLPHPSPALWAAVAARNPSGDLLSRNDRPPLRPRHPLLASLSRDVQELQETLAPIAAESVHHLPPGEQSSCSLLGALQAGLRDDELHRADGVDADGTVEVHACHGPQRQTEVLRDRLLHLFSADPTLEPRDVLIMCPDVETYAPLIRGVFGQQGLDHPAFSLRVRLADRGLRQQNAVLDVVARVLDLGAGRLRAGDVIDLVASEPVRLRFGFSDDDVETVSGWVRRSGVRWGVDVTARERFGLAGFPQGTVQTGLDRIMLGVVAEESENEWLSTALPLSGIDSTDTDLAGRFAEFAARIAAVLDDVSGRHSTEGWLTALTRAVDLLTDVTSETEWQRAQAMSMLTDALGRPENAPDLVLDPSDLRDLMAALVAARPTRSNFCTGELTVCSMVPMRSVPHRVIIVLGMDSGAYPRSASADGDDILTVTPMVGERNTRDEDRQVFLDAMCAATDHLLVFYTGADALTGARTPPAVVVSELLDSARAILGVPTDDDNPVLIRHSLHAFDESNFTGEVPFSYDAALLPAARALSGLVRSGRRGAPAWTAASEPLPPADTAADVDLDELITFLCAPVDGYARQRLGVGIPDIADEHRDELAVDLDGLERWGVGDRFLGALLGGADPAAARGAELRRGTLPPFAFGARVLAPVSEKAQAIAVAAAGYRDESADAVDVRVRLADGRRIYGTVGDVFAQRLVPVSFSRLGPKHRLGAWIRLLAMAAGSDAGVREAVVIGGAKGRHASAQVSRLTAPDDAAEILRLLVAIRDAGLSAPVGLTLDAASAAAHEFERSGRVDRALGRARGQYGFSYSDASKYAGLVFHGDVQASVSFDTLSAAVPSVAELSSVADDLPGDRQTDMYVRLASVLFGPLLRNESDR